MGLLLSGASEPSASSAGKLGAIVRDRIRTPYWHSPDPSDIAASDAALDELLDLGVEIGPRPGRLYEVEIGYPEESLLDWHAPMSQQRGRAAEYAKRLGDKAEAMTGQDFYTRLGEFTPSKKEEGWGGFLNTMNDRVVNPRRASEQLIESGVPGIKYLDAGSRGAGQGTHNYVIFPGAEDKIRILRKYGLLGPLLAAPAAAAPQQDKQPSLLDGLRTN
jgi:hypothetical protein